jgi:PAS domain S-box-containing protein
MARAIVLPRPGGIVKGSVWQACIASAVAALLAIGMTVQVQPLFERTPFALPMLVIVAAAWFGGQWAAATATLATAAGMLPILVQHGPITIDTPGRFIQVIIFTIVAVAATVLTARSREVANELQITLDNHLRAKHALESSEQRFRALIEQSWEAIALFSADGRILYASPATTRVLGYEVEQFVGRSAFEFIHPDDHPFVLGRIQLSLEQPGSSVDVHARVKHQNGTWRELEGVFTNLLSDPNVGAIVNNYRDVTERRQLERQFLHAQKMEAIGRLAGGVAHDFNNLLTVIIGHVELSTTAMASPTRVRRDLEDIRTAARRGAALTQQLLAFARKQVILPQTIDLNELLQRVDTMLRRVIGEDIDLLTQAAPGLRPVKVDPSQVEQVLLNLAINARDAMPRGGRLTLETADVRLDDSYVQQHPEVAVGDYVMLAISDTGVGMTDDVKAHVFEPFFTTKDQGTGTGLGLATCYGIVRQHGGHLWVYSEPERGTTFKLYFPAASGVPSEQREMETARTLMTGSETILLAEDDEAVRGITRDVLRQCGYVVLEAGDANEALRAEAQYGEVIHLLITDVVMPRMGGEELAQQLTMRRPSMKTLFISGYTETALIHQETLYNGAAYLPKPFTPQELVAKVRVLLDA